MVCHGLSVLIVDIENWSHKKEWYWVICRDVDGPRVCHTEWNRSERGKKMLHVNTWMWNLGKMVQKNLYYYYFFCRAGVEMQTEVEKGHVNKVGGGRAGSLGWTYGHCHVWNRQLVGTCSAGSSAQSSVVMYTGGWVEGAVQEGGDIRTHTADSLPWTAETNIVQHLHSN